MAETALRFLELVQLKTLNMENEPDNEEVDEATRPNGDYDTGCVTPLLKSPSFTPNRYWYLVKAVICDSLGK